MHGSERREVSDAPITNPVTVLGSTGFAVNAANWAAQSKHPWGRVDLPKRAIARPREGVLTTSFADVMPNLDFLELLCSRPAVDVADPVIAEKATGCEGEQTPPQKMPN